MEATSNAQGLLDKIQPPRLEDAGLEDCALPPDSIKEAFLKAAIAVGSSAATSFSNSEEEEGWHSVEDPWVEEEEDDMVGVREGVDPPPGGCLVEKGSGVGEVMGDEVGAGLTESEERGNKVVDMKNVVEEGRGEACVDGLKGSEREGFGEGLRVRGSERDGGYLGVGGERRVWGNQMP